MSPYSRRPDPTKCKSGRHEWIPENIRTARGHGERCRLCDQERDHVRRAKLPPPPPRVGRPTAAVAARLEDYEFLRDNGVEFTAACKRLGVSEAAMRVNLAKWGAVSSDA